VTRVALVTLGCGRNEVDSDQVAGSLTASGMDVVATADDADVVLVNTCTFIEAARQESLEAIMDVCEPDGPPVLVIGCMAQRYGDELADALPEVAGVLGFADYPRLPQIVSAVLGRGSVDSASPEVPKRGLPLLVSSPGTAAARTAPAAPPNVAFPMRTQPRGPWAYLKLASGCDRVCTFCSIPSFRGRFASRPLDELLAEARWLAAQGVRELVCVSENTTSWGKDLPGGRRAQLDLIRSFEQVDGLERVRLMYLQPAELLPEVLDAMAASPVVAGYYDLSLQHASGPVLARMARSGDADRFLSLIEGIRRRDPGAVFRSSFITGFPGETEHDVAVVEQFLAEARLDWAGVFAYSPEEGTPAATMQDQVDVEEARARRSRLLDVADAVAEDNAAGFVRRELDVLVERAGDGASVGRSYREAPETDGEVRVPGCDVPVGRMLRVRVTAADGVDLVAEPA
jgi:ribosomal protein S12 methylthiotransferase